MPSTDTVLEHHLMTFAEQDLSGILEDYTEKSVIVTNRGTFRGFDEIKGLFKDFFTEFSPEEATIDVEEEIIEDEFAYIIWQGESTENVYEFATETFYIPEDTILFQTFAGKSTQKHLVE